MTTLTFKTTTLSVINQNNHTFLTSNDLGTALEYANPLQAINKLYNSNADEFTAEMTALIELQTAGGKQQVRVFSLRGAHLIAMFARTKVAKEFRKWVLDILDREILQNEQQNQPQQLAIEHKKAVEPEKEVKPFTDKELHLLVRVWHHSEIMRHWLLKLSDPLKWLNSSYADDAFEAQTFKRDLQDFRFLLIQHCEHIQRHTSSNIHPTAFEQMVYDMRKMCLRINTGREIINPI